MTNGRTDIKAAFGALWRALAGHSDPAERRIALDAIRDALDRNAGHLAETPTANPDGRFLANSFALEAKIAEGGSATLFRARHRDLGTLHAVKMLKVEYANDPAHRRLFLAEAQHHLRIRDPAVVEAECLLRAGDGRPALVLRFVDSRSLAQAWADDGTTFGEDDVTRLVRRLADALDAVHAAGLVHLDVSPGNVLLPAGGSVDDALLCDLGLSLPEGEGHGGVEIAAAATPAFAAPEQRSGTSPLDRRTDVFALGRLAEWMLQSTGTDRLAPFVAAACAPDPHRRPADMAAVRVLLDACQRKPRHGDRAFAPVDGWTQGGRKAPPEREQPTFVHARSWNS